MAGHAGSLPEICIICIIGTLTAFWRHLEWDYWNIGTLTAILEPGLPNAVRVQIRPPCLQGAGRVRNDVYCVAS